MNNWYIRRSRARFWRSDHDQDKQDAYDTLYSVLLTVAKVAAPLMPLLTEAVYRGLTGKHSVHLEDWPSSHALPTDDELVAAMDRARDVCSVALSLRDAHKLRTRLPLSKLTVAGDGVEALGPYVDLIRDEVNVKQVELTGDVGQFGTFQLQVNARAVGKKLGPNMKATMAASKSGDWKLLDDGKAKVGPSTLEPGEFSMRLQSKEGVASQALSSNDAVAVLDTEVTPELEQEGIARDAVRSIQQARKEADLNISDHIALTLDTTGDVQAALSAFEGYIREQTLADSVEFDAPAAGAHESRVNLGSAQVVIGLQRVT
jgi:isoleucyl-tRNA synthetase